MLKRNLLSHLTCSGIPRSCTTLSFIAGVALFFGSALPSQSQIFKLPPVVYQSGGNMAQWAVVADVNRDGKPDVIVTNRGEFGSEPSVGVLLGNGDGTFQTAVTYGVIYGGPDAVAVADLNGDGWPDLVVGSYDGVCAGPCVSVLLNKGDGTFQAAVGYSSVGFYIRCDRGR